ncbi:MAG: DUF1572 family protein [Ferruginibacter sp.]
MKNSIIEIFDRDIIKLKDEIIAYKDEKNLWLTSGTISNSAGNLALHLVGNLNHFIGKVLGKNNYVRKREEEFSLKNIPAAQLLVMISQVKNIVIDILTSMDENDLGSEFPEKKHDKILTTDFMLLHLLAHFNYHLGQINYHRRLLDN